MLAEFSAACLARAYPSDTQNVIRIPDLRYGPRGHDHKVDHPCHDKPTAQGEEKLAQLALLPAQLLALTIDEVAMFGGEIRLYSRSSILEILAAGEQRNGYRNSNQTGDGGDEVREELSLQTKSAC